MIPARTSSIDQYKKKIIDFFLLEKGTKEKGTQETSAHLLNRPIITKNEKGTQDTSAHLFENEKMIIIFVS